MSEQTNAAAERSAHVERGPRRIPGESFLVEISPGVFQIKALAEARAEIERLRAQLAQTRTVAAAAVKAARREGIEAAAKVAEWAHMVPPDGGSPTDAEYEIAKTAAQRIRALLRDHDIHHADQLANDILERLAAQGFVAVPVSTVTKEDSNERLWVEIVLLEATGVEAADEIERLRLALRIIAGYEQCIDNLMSHGDVARAVLKGGKP